MKNGQLLGVFSIVKYYFRLTVVYLYLGGNTTKAVQLSYQNRTYLVMQAE